MSTPTHPLDRPVWNALTGRWAPRAVQAGEALRLGPDYGHFAATPELTVASLQTLTGLDIDENGLHLVEPEPIEAPAGLAIALQASLVQMVAEGIEREGADLEVLSLGEADGPEMFALAQLTRPGPFAARTHALGGFIGVRSAGRLIAMAGERMRTGGFCEVSGVCTIRIIAAAAMPERSCASWPAASWTAARLRSCTPCRPTPGRSCSTNGWASGLGG